MKLSALFLSTLTTLSSAAVVQRDSFTADTSLAATKTGDLIYVPGAPTIIITQIKTVALTTITKAAPPSTVTTTVTVTAGAASKQVKRDEFTVDMATKTWSTGDFMYVPGILTTKTVTAVETVGGVVKTVTREVVVTKVL